MRNNAISETELLLAAEEAIRTRLPSGWSVMLQTAMPAKRSFGDGLLELRAPDNTTSRIIVEVKQKPFEARGVLALVDILNRARTSLAGTDQLAYLPMVLVSPFLGPSSRFRLTEYNINYVDLTGNIRFVSASPAVFIFGEGATKNPWREPLPLKSLKGPSSGRAVRGFLDYTPPFGIRDLATVTASSPAAISRVADLLERETILSRESRRGKVVKVEWERLLRRWTADYEFSKTNAIRTMLEPRGTRALLDKLRHSQFRYAITGSFAGVRYAPIAEPRLVSLYVEEPEVAQRALGLREADTGANVLLARPFDSVVFERTVSFDQIVYAAHTQVAADLLTGPGRNPAEAESLITWMKENESAWKKTSNPDI